MSKNKTMITAEPGKQEVFITREFDAPRELVFKAHTDPQLFAKWIGPRNLVTNLETFEPVSGGRWRFVQKDPGGVRADQIAGDQHVGLLVEHPRQRRGERHQQDAPVVAQARLARIVARHVGFGLRASGFGLRASALALPGLLPLA